MGNVKSLSSQSTELPHLSVAAAHSSSILLTSTTTSSSGGLTMEQRTGHLSTTSTMSESCSSSNGSKWEPESTGKEGCYSSELQYNAPVPKCVGTTSVAPELSSSSCQHWNQNQVPVSYRAAYNTSQKKVFLPEPSGKDLRNCHSPRALPQSHMSNLDPPNRQQQRRKLPSTYCQQSLGNERQTSPFKRHAYQFLSLRSFRHNKREDRSNNADAASGATANQTTPLFWDPSTRRKSCDLGLGSVMPSSASTLSLTNVSSSIKKFASRFSLNPLSTTDDSDPMADLPFHGHDSSYANDEQYETSVLTPNWRVSGARMFQWHGNNRRLNNDDFLNVAREVHNPSSASNSVSLVTSNATAKTNVTSNHESLLNLHQNKDYDVWACSGSTTSPSFCSSSLGLRTAQKSTKYQSATDIVTISQKDPYRIQVQVRHPNSQAYAYDNDYYSASRNNNRSSSFRKSHRRQFFNNGPFQAPAASIENPWLSQHSVVTIRPDSASHPLTLAPYSEVNSDHYEPQKPEMYDSSVYSSDWSTSSFFTLPTHYWEHGSGSNDLLVDDVSRSDHGYGSSGTYYLDYWKQSVGRVPSYVQLKNGRLMLKLIRDDVMDEHSEGVSVREVVQLLRCQYAVVTGGRSREGCPILNFPDRGNLISLAEEDYRKMMIYLTSVPTLQDADLGFVLVIDRRTDRWNSVKATLLRISHFFPGLITTAYVLRPSGLLQKAISEVSNKFFKEDFKFRVIVCNCLEELHHRIDPSQLTPDLGGYLCYDHVDWIETRVAVENFSGNTNDLSAALRKFSRKLQDTELPNDVSSTEQLLATQGHEYVVLKEDLKSACRQGETLLQLMRQPLGAGVGPSYEPFPSQLVNITAVERLLIQMDETDRTIDNFWHRHRTQLEQCLQLRRFELDFRELQVCFDANMKELSDVVDTGDSLIRIDTLIQDALNFKTQCQDDVNRAEDLYLEATKLMAEYAQAPTLLDSIRPKSIELQRMCQSYREQLTKKLETLHKARDLHDRIDKANRWCAEGVDLLASQQMEKCTSVEYAEQALAEIETFLATASSFKLHNPREFRTLFQDLITLDTKALIHQVLKRIEDVQVMCEKRTFSLRKLAVRTPRPVQTVNPEVNNTVTATQVKEVQNKRTSTASDSGDGSTSSRDPDMIRVKRGHVLAELLDTERLYVSEIGIILKGYRDELINPDQQNKIPVALLGKEDVLFGNLDELYEFHQRVFLADLEKCITSPQLVAVCFAERKDKFHSLYSYYCQSIPQSEELRRNVNEQQNGFLRECQMRLGHKLPLGAYLLKPVQRITKYQLLLKDLIKYSDEEDHCPELQSALDCMLAVLRCVNDSMHQVAITGYNGSLADLGRLLLQGSFNMWPEGKKEGKKDRLKELRLKSMQRHVFLYEKAVLFCKRVGKDPDKATYQFKHHLKMSEVGLTETVHSGRGSDARKFELWLQGRQEVWVLQAPARDVKETWVCEVKRVLFSQFQQLKGQSKGVFTLPSLTTRSGLAPNNGRNNLTSQASSTAIVSPNGHKFLRQTSSWEYGSTSSSGVSSAGDRSSVAESNGSTTNSDTGSANESNTPNNTRLVRAATTECSHVTSYTTPSTPYEEEEGWSTDFSLSDDDGGEPFLDRSEPIPRRYVVLADYAPLGPGEATLREADLVELVRVGCAGWWFVRILGGAPSSQEGWAPSAYLEPVLSKKPLSSGTPSLSSQDSGMEHELVG